MGPDTSYLSHDFARFYDWTYEGYVEDIPLYLEAARKHGSPLLELACGTGRLTIPLAREGFTITGLDISQAMLDIARRKLAEEPPEVCARVRLLQGDMTSFALAEQMNLALIPFASLFHVHATQAKADCLSCLHKHLAPGGLAIIDLVAARTMAPQAVGEARVTKSGVSPGTGKMTKELNKRLYTDPARQRVTIEHTYIEEEPDGGEARFVFTEDYTWVTEREMRDLLREAGFEQISVFGDYDRSPFDDASSRMILLALK